MTTNPLPLPAQLAQAAAQAIHDSGMTPRKNVADHGIAARDAMFAVLRAATPEDVLRDAARAFVASLETESAGIGLKLEVLYRALRAAAPLLIAPYVAECAKLRALATDYENIGNDAIRQLSDAEHQLEHLGAAYNDVAEARKAAEESAATLRQQLDEERQLRAVLEAQQARDLEQLDAAEVAAKERLAWHDEYFAKFNDVLAGNEHLRKQLDAARRERDPWREFLHPKGLCGICGNHGWIDMRGVVFSPAGVECGVKGPCICLNGRALAAADAGEIPRVTDADLDQLRQLRADVDASGAAGDAEWQKLGLAAPPEPGEGAP